MKFHKIVMLSVGVILAAGTISAPTLAAGDAAKGKRVFNKCKVCHKTEAGKKGIGPNLHGVFGRKAGTLAGFKYSDDMVAAGKKGLVWSAETFSGYIAAPKEYIGGLIGKKKARTKMVFNGLKKSSDRDDLIAYLMKETK